MKRVIKWLKKDKYTYTYPGSIAEFKTEIEKLCKRKWYDFYPNLDVRFVNEKEFLASKRFILCRSTAASGFTLIRGVISECDEVTHLKIVIRPNNSVYGFLIFPLMMGIAFLYHAFLELNTGGLQLFIGGLALCMISFAAAFIGHVVKNDLRDIFVDTFHLKLLA